LSPYDQQPKIKIYREQQPAADGVRDLTSSVPPCKGDCLICYNAEESVQLAVDVLSGGYLRPDCQIQVTRAEFGAGGSGSGSSSGSSSGGAEGTANGQQHEPKPRRTLSQAQVKVAKSATKQALTWNEDDDIGVARSAALRIIVLEGLFVPSDFTSSETFSDELESDVAGECQKCGEIEKLTFFSSNPRGIAVVKFTTSYAAQECIRLMNGRYFAGRKLKSYFWDGVANYSVTMNSAAQEEAEEAQEQGRLEEFGDWLEQEQEELPEEFRLRQE
jgi:HIV Tat-specific factor 1